MAWKKIEQKWKPLKPITSKLAVSAQPKMRFESRLAKAREVADTYKKEAERSASFGGMLKNTIKAVPRETARILTESPVKLGLSLKKELLGGKGNMKYLGNNITTFKEDFNKAEREYKDGKIGKLGLGFQALKPALALAEIIPVAKAVPTFTRALSSGKLLQGAKIATDSLLPTNFSRTAMPKITPDTNIKNPQWKPIPKSDMSITQNIDVPINIQKKSKKIEPGRILSVPRQLITSGGRVLRESGGAGRDLEALIRKQLLEKDIMVGKDNRFISQALGGLNKADKEEVTRVLEGGTTDNKKILNSAEKLRGFYKLKADEIKKREFAIGDEPFKERLNYSPRFYNFDELAKGRQREKAVNHLVQTGQARNPAEAERLLQVFLENKKGRSVGNIEKHRELDLPGYELNAELNARNYAEKSASRFTESDLFGKKDEIIANLINKISQEGGDYNEAQKIFDEIYKSKTPNQLIDTITKFNLVTKLDLGAITNVGQVVNTILKTGYINTAKAIIKSFTKEGNNLAELANVYDDMVAVQESGLKMGKFVKGVMYLFGKVERFNRRTAAIAGKYHAEDLIKTINKNPESGYALRNLEKIGLSPEKIINGKLSADDLTRAMTRIAEMTQFKPNALNVPRLWKTPLGRIITQFKSFSFMQTRFIMDEVIKEAGKGNFAPLMRLVSIAPFLSTALYSLRNKITGRNPKEEKDALDVRTLDKYMKVAGSNFTEPFVQGKYLRDLYKNQYATPLEKVSKTLSSVGGVTVGEIGNTLVGLEGAQDTKDTNRLYNQHKDPYLESKRQVTGFIPFVGEYMKNKGLPYEKSSTQLKKQLLEDMKDGMISESGTINKPGFLGQLLNGDKRAPLEGLMEATSKDRSIMRQIKIELEALSRMQYFKQADEEEQKEMLDDKIKEITSKNSKLKNKEKKLLELLEKNKINNKPYYGI